MTAIAVRESTSDPFLLDRQSVGTVEDANMLHSYATVTVPDRPIRSSAR